MSIDLHMHTNYSDGTLSPKELVDLVKKQGLKIIAVTDHDEIGANEQAWNYGVEQGVEVIPGVELSIEYNLEGRGHLHLLGLFIDSGNAALQEQLLILKEARNERIGIMIQKLAAAGVNLDRGEVDKMVGHGSAGRPHVASLLLKEGYARSMIDGFRRFLGKGCPGYVPKKKLPIQAAIDLIHGAGGLAILAHPVSLAYPNYPRLGQEILKLKDIGLDGIEVFYSSHDRYITKWLLDFSRVNNLAVSGGSDFHGATKPDVQPAIGRGNLRIPPLIADLLRERVELRQDSVIT